MISKIDIEIYKEIFQVKTVTEKYLGYTSFDWIYSSIKYQADCTLAIPFNLFDKVIVGILLVDEMLSIEELGEILGLNLINNPEIQQYKDEAEYDILRIALDNLKDYEMIEIGDTSYSSCKLTKNGKDFAEKGYKFRVDKKRQFHLFYDHISNNHVAAKQELELLKGKPIPLIDKFNFSDELLMQQIAEVQVPEIHSPSLGNSFINAITDRTDSHSYSYKIEVALLFDVSTKKIRLLAIEPISKKINDYFTLFINDNRNNFIELFEPPHQENILIDSEISYLQQLTEGKTKIEELVTENPQEALAVYKYLNTEAKIIDQEFFWLNLNQFIPKPSDEIYLLLPQVTEFMIAEIKKLATDRNSPALFIVFQQSENEVINNRIKELYHFSKNEHKNLFVAMYNGLKKFDCFVSTDNKISAITELPLDFTNTERLFFKPFYERKFICQNEIPELYLEIKRSIAEDYLGIIERNIEDLAGEAPESSMLNKAFIIEQYNITKKAKAFTNTALSETAKETFEKINENIDNYISGLKEKHKQLLSEKIENLLIQFEGVNSEKLEDIANIEASLKSVEVEFFEGYSELSLECENLKNKISAEIKRIKDEVLAKTYIIDTNVFIKEPNIISKIDLTKHYVALSFSVIEELEKLKMRPANKENATKAIQNINSMLKAAKHSKRNRVRRQGADLTLLPSELQNKSADNMILSLGLVYKKQNPVILTLDRNFQSKAMTLDIPVVTVYDLLEIKQEPRLKKVLKPQIDYIRIFEKMKPDEYGDHRISNFIKQIKEQYPSFNRSQLGFKSDAAFMLSLNIFIVSKDKAFFKLK
jgi:rRNA-processing protein FCF1